MPLSYQGNSRAVRGYIYIRTYVFTYIYTFIYVHKHTYLIYMYTFICKNIRIHLGGTQCS